MLRPLSSTVARVLCTAALCFVAAEAPAAMIAIPLGAFSTGQQVVSSFGPLPFTDKGATFEVSGAPAFPGAELTLQFLGSTPTLHVTFSQPTNRAGFSLGPYCCTGTAMSLAVQAFADPAGAVPVGTIPFSFVNSGTFPLFAGFQSDAPFRRASITFTPGGPQVSFMAIDDFRFEGTTAVPEPVSVSLILLGLAGAGVRLSRTVGGRKATRRTQ
ncbi:hypothetical protein LuPra_00371 [Luteitalea pratensis]|uniref:PEP-CTERM protein-sorting domain-containing protein n=2 Tax=Luteitalea pratensis TaxID=1855912 RepID=A0A143PHH6_LUTPR|nr:hypothetical protein LuPra_00371 [Luteitalea pratensis]